jgi:chromosome partitioning protein
MILTVGNTKGGVGKSTIALNIALARRLTGRNVWFIDADIQNTSKTAMAVRATSELKPVIAFAKYPEAALLRSQIQQQRANFDDIIIDVGGRDTKALRAAVFLSDAVLVPFNPRSFEVWAMEEMAEVIADAHQFREELVAYAFVNEGDTSAKSTDNEDAIEAIAEFPQFTLLPVIVSDRKTFSNEGGKGKSILEAKRKDRKAIKEFKDLLSHLFPSI